ncbi:MAG TPA: methyl-accepting chemotaxis protein, partial [Spirochaetia bacterium]|nr:methyl-accepting chemotaxis protein [Spirochaetia bacterium]
FNGSEKTAATAPVTSTGWSIAYTIPDSAYLGAIDKVQMFLIVISALALMAALAFYFLFARSITVPLASAVSFARAVAAGDFSSRLDVHQRDEVGALADALNGMSEKLSQMFSGILQNAELLASSSEQLSQSALRLSEGAQRQASSLEETSASVEELSASVDQVAEHAQSQAAAAARGNGSMTNALGAVESVRRKLDEISSLARKSAESAATGAASVKSMVDGITTLAESSTRIGGIVTVISDIADQTNLLALNASIEAARAGEHGRGFAVVADEVSKLAERSSTSTKEIESLIRESVRRVTASVTTAESSGEAIEQIRLASEQVSEMIARVAEAMAMQVGAVHDLAAALSNMNEMSQ